jgi:squalene-hopene/tetraprenyl-beta-curcumene cyclase
VRCLAALLSAAVVLPASVAAQAGWDAQAAATYLDGRLASWLAWPNAARDHGTTCVSCHTVLPYALARPSLRHALSEPMPTTPEEVMLDRVTTRVRLWREVEPYYPDQRNGLPKTSESRGTEAILNAVVLAERDAEAGVMSDDLRTAFSHMWALQMRRAPLAGAWAWLQFGLEPWEAPGSPYFGAALAAIAVGRAPGDYAAAPEIQEQLALLREYLGKGADSESLYNRLMILWASGELQGVLEASQQRAIVEAALAAQSPDGGWSLSALAPWERIDGSMLPDASDGYATALAVLAVQKGGGAHAAASVERGRAWLIAHQDPATGAVPAVSINRERDPATEQGKFMTDAATALASIALSNR